MKANFIKIIRNRKINYIVKDNNYDITFLIGDDVKLVLDSVDEFGIKPKMIVKFKIAGRYASNDSPSKIKKDLLKTKKFRLEKILGSWFIIEGENNFMCMCRSESNGKMVIEALKNLYSNRINIKKRNK